MDGIVLYSMMGYIIFMIVGVMIFNIKSLQGK